MKKIKCIKCSLYFKDREDPEDGETVNKTLCWNCRFIWQCIGLTLKSFAGNPFIKKPLNREVSINLEHVRIRRPRTLKEQGFIIKKK